MNTNSQPRTTRRDKGIALIIVVGVLALITILLVAMFSAAESEYKSTQSYVASQSAKQFADMAVAVVQAQILDGQNYGTGASRTTHSTQPGAVRVYASNGTFLKGLKLYSSSQMVAANESNFVAGRSDQGVPLVPGTWDLPANRARFVDMNEPVVRAPLSAAAGATSAVYFPIIDPRAAYNSIPGGSQLPAAGDRTTQVEGFSYSNQLDGGPGSVGTMVNQVVLPTAAARSDLLRLPMPVEWMYVLKDGTLGALDATDRFTSATGVQPTARNPIVGRVAFWTDDECCKININTASEPTYQGTPYYFHDRDRRWAHYPGASQEFQRYPGHPATVALSSVLYPGQLLDPYHLTRGQNVIDRLSQTDIRALKDKIYDLAPKVAGGDPAHNVFYGSESGTIPFVVDEFSTLWGDPNTAAISLPMNSAVKERLFASVDEMLFRDGPFDPQKGRVPSQITAADGTVLFDHDVLERTRFFLTAHSRAPEFTMHGLPRVCIWPVADETWPQTHPGSNNYGRTNYDNEIALCSTLASSRIVGSQGPGSYSYFFRRLEPHHATADVTGTSQQLASKYLERNSKLLDYLDKEIQFLNYPQTSLGAGGGSNTFASKYGVKNVHQLAIEIFDYIRCINLYDSVLARGNNGSQGTGQSGTALYATKDAQAADRFTYTNQRMTRGIQGGGLDSVAGQTDRDDDAGVYPGHGQVTPATWLKDGSTYKGLGRMFTLSEVGLHFICTADGKNDGPGFTGGDMTDEGYAVGSTTGTNFSAPFPIRSGGGSAERTDPTFDTHSSGGGGNAVPTKNSLVYKDYNIAEGNARWWSNFAPVGDFSFMMTKYGADASRVADKSANPKHPSYHPGFDPVNWNMTLAVDTPLLPTQKRVQAILDLESFCPSLGWTKIYPEWTIVVSGLNQVKLNGAALFNTAQSAAVISNGNLYEASNVHPVGGHAAPTALQGGRATRSVSGQGAVRIGSDTGYGANPAGMFDYQFTSDFITVKRDDPMQITMPAGGLTFTIYDSINWQGRQPVQTITVQFPGTFQVPPPALVGQRNGSLKHANLHSYVENGALKYKRSLQGPHWWVFNVQGSLGRMSGRVNSAYKTGGTQPFWLVDPYQVAVKDLPQELKGRLDTTSGASFPMQGAAQGFSSIPDSSSDTIRTMVPAFGDYRVIAAMKDVPAAMWMQHPMWLAQSAKDPLTQLRTIHSYTNMGGESEPGFRLAVSPSSGGVDRNTGIETPPSPDQRLQMVSQGYSDSYDPTTGGTRASGQNEGRLPDLPPDNSWATAANSFGDFDAGIGPARDGPYINKPDEGNFYATKDTRYLANGNPVTKYYRSGYFFNAWRQTDDWRNGIYMTPNRLVCSPVMFGSLPTGVYNDGGSVPVAAQALGGVTYGSVTASSSPSRPWQTLLFRPFTKTTGITKNNHPGEFNPVDHYILDLFTMPVVEPYAISEPLSTAGKLNINYQILPFTNIKRATGMYALMKGEFMTAIPISDNYSREPNAYGKGYAASGAVVAKQFRSSTISSTQFDTFQDEGTDAKFYHRPINAKETVAQLEERFRMDNNLPSRTRGLLRSASQICELYLVPQIGQGESSSSSPVTNLVNMSVSNRTTKMESFWSAHRVTPDNIRERPYSNLYARLTTRSNTFRVHYRSQVLKKARDTAPDTFVPDRDAVLSEYRGSSVLERYIDTNDENNLLPDYANLAEPLNALPLETFYRFRVLETKRFSP